MPLRTTPRDEAILRTRFDAACSAYNALLGECLRRSRLLRESRAWRAAGKMPKGKEKTAAYRELNKKYGFREYDLYQFVRTMRAGATFHPTESSSAVSAKTSGQQRYVGHHLDCEVVAELASRA